MALKHLTFAFLAASLAFFTTTAPAWAEPLKIVGFGDSLMAGYGLNPGESFPEKLEKALRNNGHDVVITNAGVSGDTSSGGLSRLDWSVPDGTQLVILELGANDMLRGIDPALVEQNLDKMLARLKERNIPVLLAGMVAAPNLGHAYGEQFGTIYPKLAEKYGVTLYPFFLDGVAGDPKLLLEDGMHPTAEGIDRMVAKALPTVEKAIAGK
ncbi:arylesterase [Aminobacter aminovorans]|uniref:arylesterase n=1 Tax=Aminobacter aminovorans TaxID=83263 RepID=UPI002865F218|nr:arylesterase [Aminobacter aminovorans]MDR7223955.1 acyl-CoA thioesterase-1 [Aminobacter aminovorans]